MPRVHVHLPRETEHEHALRVAGLQWKAEWGGVWTTRMCEVRLRALRAVLGPDVRVDPPPTLDTPES